jgi:flagellar basal body-associated protein FliL
VSDEMKPTEDKKVGWGSLVWLLIGVVVVIFVIAAIVIVRLS